MSSLCMECSSKMEGLFSSKQASNEVVQKLNQFCHVKEVICSKCAVKIANQEIENRECSLTELNMQIDLASMEIAKDFIVSSSAAPSTAQMKGLVTGYSALGTGVLTEIASTFTDAFGAQSESYQIKLRESENFARQDLIAKAINLDATAIYDTRLQITEATSGKGILLVCFCGSAVIEKEVSEVFLERKKYIQAKQKLEDEVSLLKQIVDEIKQ